MTDLLDALYRPQLNYLKKEAYSGSLSGLRFKLEKYEEGEERRLRLWTWPEPFCFEKTADEDKAQREYAFDTDGLNAAIDFLMSLQEEEV